MAAAQFNQQYYNNDAEMQNYPNGPGNWNSYPQGGIGQQPGYGPSQGFNNDEYGAPPPQYPANPSGDKFTAPEGPPPGRNVFQDTDGQSQFSAPDGPPPSSTRTDEHAPPEGPPPSSTR